MRAARLEAAVAVAVQAAETRARVVHDLEACGAARLRARRRAALELERVAALIPRAKAAGLPMTEISRLTGLSRPTLYELERRGPAGDVAAPPL